MLKFLAKDSLTFDTETIPDVEAGRRLLSMSADDYADASVRNAMFAAHPDYDEHTNPTPFLKPILQQIVSIAAVRRTVSHEGVRVRLSVLSWEEPEAIRRFLKVVGDNSVQLVGYNSEGFDLPLLIQRALVHGISVPAFCKRPNKPWEGRDLHARYSDWHIDLLREIGGFGRVVPSLSEACAAMSILGGAKDVTGADVLDLVLAGDLASVHRYCAKDAVRHFLILLRLCVLAGHVSPDEAAREEADVCAQLEEYAAKATEAVAG